MLSYCWLPGFSVFCYYEHSCTSLCGHMFLLGENIRMELLDHKVGVYLVL